MLDSKECCNCGVLDCGVLDCGVLDCGVLGGVNILVGGKLSISTPKHFECLI